MMKSKKPKATKESDYGAGLCYCLGLFLTLFLLGCSQERDPYVRVIYKETKYKYSDMCSAPIGTRDYISYVHDLKKLSKDVLLVEDSHGSVTIDDPCAIEHEEEEMRKSEYDARMKYQQGFSGTVFSLE